MKEKPPVYLELNLNNTRPRPMGMIRSLPKPYTELELLWLIKNATRDKKLSGLILNTSGFSANRAFLWELKTALSKFKESGKKIIAYFDEAEMDLYCMVSTADKIVMDRSGTLSFMGYTMGRLYVKETLEKIGAGFRELRYLDYKTANEMFSRTTLSQADKEQYGAYLDETFNLTKETIIKARGLDEERFNSLLNGEFLLPPQTALEKGLVDALGREDAIEATIKEWGVESRKRGAGDNSEPSDKNSVSPPRPIPESAETIDQSQVSSPVPIYKVWGASSLMTHGRHVPHYEAPRIRGRKAEIALVLAKGNTDMDQGMAARNLSRVIFEAAEKSAVKALILRVDSPGGSAIAADYIAQAVEEVKKDKPVVVTLGQVAASGGYWAAMNASHITASPYTLTGSIGVIAGWFFNKGLTEKLGVNVDSLARGDHADLLSGFLLPSRDLSADEETQYRRVILELYDEFVKKAAKGRNMKEEELEPLARGRIYSGSSALNLKLIDSLGGYLEALETARKMAGLPEKKKLVIREYPRPKFYESLAARFLSASIKAGIGSEEWGIGSGVVGEAVSALSVSKEFLRVREPSVREDLIYRLSQNGRAMPILPLGSWG